MAVARARRAGSKRADPRSDPRYRRVVDKLNADSSKLKQHPPPSKKSDESNKAAKGPANEKAAGARAKQVDKLEEAETPKPQTASFLEMLRAEIAKVMPKTLGDTEKFMKGGASGEIKGALKGEVANQKDAATGDLQQTSNAQPSEAGVPSKPVAPIPPEPNAPTPQVNAAAAMPAPKADAEISLQDSKAEVGDARKETKQTDTRLKNANDPRFSAVMDADKAVQKQADAGPGQYRGSEKATLSKATGQAVGTAKKGVVNLLKTKSGSKTKVLSRQEQQKAKEELELKKFTDFVVSTFEGVKTSVDKRLERLEETVNTLFDTGTDAAIARMKSYVEDQLFQYKMDRYLLRVGGSLLWIRDQILDLPPEVNRFYDAGRKLFTGAMDALAARVASLVERELAAAKGEVSSAQGRIAAAQAALSPAVRARGAQVAGEYAEKFNELKSGIEDKKQQLAEGLAQKYKEAFDKAEEALKAIQDENKGLVTKAKEKIEAVAKALMEFKDKLMAVLRKGAETIDLILDNPGGFLSNLLAAIKGGFSAFAGNILGHLKRGFVKWLFGAMAGTGVEIPSDLSLPSILKLVLGVLGITYDRMRAKAVKLLGPTAVAVIEKLAGYLMTLIGGGPAALWEQIKGDLGNLKDMVIGAIQDWVISTIVKKAVAKVVSMFNPVGAIIQAILMIVNVVMFVIERAAQIMEFVESVVNSIHAIATGAIGGAISKVEQALGNMVPILIGFLAALIGLGGIGAKIKGFIQKVQAKVDQAIDKVLKKAVAFVKKLFGKLTGKKDAKPDERTDAQKKAALNAAIDEASVLALNKEIPAKKLGKRLAAIKTKHKLTELTFSVKDGGDKKQIVSLHAAINPDKDKDVTKPKVEMTLVTVDFKAKSSLDQKEFGDQIRVQLSELKALTVEEFLKRRSEFKARLADQKKRKLKSPHGRDPAGDKLAAAHREQKIQDKATQIKKDNPTLSASAALDQARKWAESKAVIHKLDQIAGGSGTKVEEELGDARVDYSIGAQWRSVKRVGAIESAAEKVPTDSRPEVNLNVSLTVNGKSVV